MHEYSKKNKTKTKTFFFQTEVSHPDKAGSMISFGDVEVARINLGAGLMAHLALGSACHTNRWKLLTFCFGKRFIWQVVSTKINCSSLTAILERTEKSMVISKL